MNLYIRYKGSPRFLMDKSMCVNREAVFLKRKEHQLCIQNIELNSSCFMYSVVLGKLLSLPEPWILQLKKWVQSGFCCLVEATMYLRASGKQRSMGRGWPVCQCWENLGFQHQACPWSEMEVGIFHSTQLQVAQHVLPFQKGELSLQRGIIV